MSALNEFSDVLNEIAADNPELGDYIVQEALPRVNAMLQLEDRGWEEFFSGVTRDDTPGADLEQVKDISDTAREMTYGSPLISRGLDLRTSYVWSKGIKIAGVEEEKPTRRGPRSRKQKFFSDTRNKRYLLSSEAHKDMEAAAFTDGAFIYLGDDSKKTGHPVPLFEIDAVFLDPDYSGEIIALRRSFHEYKPSGQKARRIVWYYLDTYDGTRSNPQPDTKDGTVPIEVDTSKTLFVKTFNTLIGWPIGVPDALPALKWARFYAEMVNDGRIVSKANAKFVYKVKNSTPKGASNAAAKASSAKGVGNVAGMGDGNDLIAIPQANRSYDFNGLRPIAAQVATALNVSVVHLLSDPGAAGSSYGSAANLDLPTKRAMVSRQMEWVEFLERILEWGTGEELTVTFPSLDDPDPYREMQLITMGWNSGTVHTDEMRERTLAIGGFDPKHNKAPAGVMLPNNSKSLNRQDIDNDAAGDGTQGDGVASTASSPDQGTRNGTGGTSDSIAKDLRNEAMETKLVEVSRQLEYISEQLSQHPSCRD